MPAVTSGKILVTGASGLIGAWIVKCLLDREYDVLVAMRTQEQLDFIQSRYPSNTHLSGIIVADITAPGAYDAAVSEVDAIIHTASPARFTYVDAYEDIINPAVNGVVGMLASAAKAGKNVKRVIFTSSGNTLEGDGDVWDETLWAKKGIAALERDGNKTEGRIVYAASKALSERAAWDFVEKEKLHYELTTILPTWNFGPYVHDVSGKRGVGSTPGIFLAMLSKGGDTSGNRASTFVDARDAALVHILALESEQAGGERITASSGEIFAWQDVYDILYDANLGIKSSLPPKEATYGAGKNKTLLPRISNEKSLRLFESFKYRSMEESVVDMGRQMIKDGFLS
ncbi:NAD(P)-binding protein [Clavulina sp. PMI_390]|nr:NAD(P)-binding protein [Clavulina sp. PMI_390]